MQIRMSIVDQDNRNAFRGLYVRDVARATGKQFDDLEVTTIEGNTNEIACENNCVAGGGGSTQQLGMTCAYKPHTSHAG
jgi:predicted flavoprotein YhiN